MSKHIAATRRMFLKNGALLAAPVAAASAAGSACALALAGAQNEGKNEGSLKARLAHLEDEAAIRELHRSWLRGVNAGEPAALLETSVRRITADHAGFADRIEIAADGRNATGHFDYAVELETRLPEDSTPTQTLVQMAHAQGGGSVHRTERRLLTVDYSKSGDGKSGDGKTSGGWSIERLTWRS